MNRDELVEAVFGVPMGELPQPRRWFSLTEPDDRNPYRIHTRSICGLDYRRVLVRAPHSTGPNVGETATTMLVATLVHVCTDPDYRDKGYATALVKGALKTAATHRTVTFAAAVATGDVAGWFTREMFGFRHPDTSPDGFLVRPLRDDDREWPDGIVQLGPAWA